MNSSVFPEFISQETQLPLLEHPSPMSSLGDDGSLNDTDSPRLDDEPSPQIGDLQEPRLSGFADPFVPRPDTLLDVPPLPLPHSSLPSSFPPMYPYSDSYSSTLPFEPELPPPPPPPFASEFGLDSGFASSTTPRDLVPYSSLAPTTTSNTSFPSSDSSVNGVMVKSEKPTKKRGRTSKKGDCKPEQTEEQRREMKRQMRLMRNRLSAQQSRERKKQHVMLLENKMQAIQDSNKQLQQRIQELMEENANLRRKLEVMSDDGNSSDGSASPKRHKLGSDVPSSLSLVRSGTMLFALVFSFALLYSLAGLDMTRFSVARSSTPSTQLARNMPMQHIGRILQSISDEDDEDDKYEFSHDSPPLPLSYEPSHGQQQQHSSSSPASAAAYSASPPAKRLSVRVPSSSSQGSHALQTRPSTAVKIHDRERDASADSMVVDLYHQKQNSIHQSLLEAVEMYKKMLIQSNYSLTDGTSIMFCPSAFHIEPRMFGKTETGSVVVRSINGSLPEGASPTESTFDPSKLLVWIPSNAISQRWNGVLNQTFSDTPRKAQPAKGRLSGVTELQVKVTDVRPILEPSTDS